MALEYVGADVHAGLVIIGYISGKFVGPIVLDKCVKFHDPSLNPSPKIQLEAVGDGIFDSFFAVTSDQK